jgi:hypothetical protein
MASAFQFANPADFSDWARYAGFNRKTGEIGVAPDSTPSMSDLQNRIGNTGDQLQQGNFVQAMKTFAGYKPPSPQGMQPAPQAQVNTPAPTYSGPYNYED